MRCGTKAWLCVFWMLGACRSTDERSTTTRPPDQGVGPQPAHQQALAFGDCSISSVQGPLKLTPYDAMAFGGESVEVSLKVEKANIPILRPDRKGVAVDFFFGGTKFSTKTTDAEGMARTSFVATQTGVQCIDAVVEQQKVAIRVFVVPPQQKILVTDIDEVISSLPEAQIPFKANHENPPLPRSAEVLRELSSRYLVIYLTARDDSLANKTSEWLRSHGFPSGPLMVWDWRIKNVFGASRKKQGEYKTQLLKDLRRKWPFVVAGIGNRAHDAEAYLSAGMKAIIIQRREKDRYPAATHFVDQWLGIRALGL